MQFRKTSSVPLSEKLTLTIDEASDLSGIGRSTVYAAVLDRTLPARKLGRSTRILPADLKGWVNSFSGFEPSLGRNVRKRRLQAASPGRRLNALPKFVVTPLVSAQPIPCRQWKLRKILEIRAHHFQHDGRFGRRIHATRSRRQFPPGVAQNGTLTRRRFVIFNVSQPTEFDKSRHLPIESFGICSRIRTLTIGGWFALMRARFRAVFGPGL